MSMNGHPAGGRGLMLSAVLRAGDQLAEQLAVLINPEHPADAPAVAAIAAWHKAINHPDRAAK